MTEFKFPDVAEGLSEGKLVEWKVKVGDTVSKEQVVADIETDKSVAEIPSPYSGKVTKLHFKEGDIVKVGEVLITFDGESSEETQPEVKKEEPETHEEEEHDAGSVVGDIPEYEAPKVEEHHYFYLKNGDAITSLNELKNSLKDIDDDTFAHHVDEVKNDFSTWVSDVLKDKAFASRLKRAKTKEEMLEILSGKKEVVPGKSSVKAMPRVRKLAEEKGVDLNSIAPTGSQGQITEGDVSKASGETVPQATTPKPEIQPANREIKGPTEVIPNSMIRKTIAKHMVEAHTITTPVLHYDEADVTDIAELREKLKEEYKDKGIKISLLSFVIRFVVRVLQKYPNFNAEFTEENIVQKKFYNIGVAVDTDRGLMVPNIKDADKKSVVELSEAIMELAKTAREGKTPIEDMRDGTFTITNAGSIGGLIAAPIINYPEVAILFVGKMTERPVVKGGEVVIRKILPLSLTYDHRIVDGADASRFVNTLKEFLEDPTKFVVE